LRYSKDQSVIAAREFYLTIRGGTEGAFYGLLMSERIIPIKKLSLKGVLQSSFYAGSTPHWRRRRQRQ
jgi:hypothetical protein